MSELDKQKTNKIFIFKWLSILRSYDAAHISRLYTFTISVVSIVGLLAAAIILLELSTNRPDILESTRFGVIMTLHAVVMVFLVLIPLFPAILGNLTIPRAVGTYKTALPRLNLIGWYLFTVGSLITILSIEIGGYDGGWKMMMPPEYASRNGFIALVIGLLIILLSNCFLNLSLLTTIFSRRHRSMTLSQLPLFVWFFALGMLLQIVFIPVRFWYLLLHIDSTVANVLTPSSVSTIFLQFKQQLFWIYINPTVLSVLVFSIAIAIVVIGNKQEKNIPKQSLLISGVILCIFSCLSWGQHLLTAIDSNFVAVTGSLYGILIMVSATYIFGVLLRTWLQNRPTHKPVNTALFGQILTFIVLAMTGIVLAIPSLGVFLNDTYVTVGHLHFGSVGIGLIGFVSGITHWWSLLSTRSLSVLWQRRWIIFIIVGVFITFVPLLIIGFGGAPRAYNDYAEELQWAHIIAAIGGTTLILSLISWLVHCWIGGRK